MEFSEDHGLSILIPIYNYDVSNLVVELLSQAELLVIPFEIICFDDGSHLTWQLKNRHLQKREMVRYSELPLNIGRSKIRNELAAAARYQFLIFLDCDSRLPTRNFLSNYWQTKLCKVVVGGRIYETAPPDLPYLLHWTVGRAREVLKAEIRNTNPYKSFMFNNVFIHKDVFQSILLDEKIMTYGHEDTKFGYELEKKGIAILHINNPATHVGLDPCEAFLKKTTEGIHNLYNLSQQGYGRDTMLYKSYRWLCRLYLEKIFLFVYDRTASTMTLKNLQSDKPSLLCFDLFKLAAFIREAHKVILT